MRALPIRLGGHVGLKRSIGLGAAVPSCAVGCYSFCCISVNGFLHNKSVLDLCVRCRRRVMRIWGGGAGVLLQRSGNPGGLAVWRLKVLRSQRFRFKKCKGPEIPAVCAAIEHSLMFWQPIYLRFLQMSYDSGSLQPQNCRDHRSFLIQRPKPLESQDLCHPAPTITGILGPSSSAAASCRPPIPLHPVAL